MSFNNKLQYCGECGIKCIKIYEHPNDKLIGYCKTHYDVVVGTCSGCHKTIGPNDQVSVLNSKRYHAQCFSANDVKCDKCTRPIINTEYKNVIGKNYHTQCFTCTLCSKNLSNTNFSEIANCPYCLDCKKEIESNPNIAISKHNASNKVVVDNTKTKELNDMKTNLYSNIQKGKESCTWCRKVISLGDVVTFNNNVYHEDCFTCNQCQSKIGRNTFTNREGLALCNDCANKTSNTVSCNKCKKPITSTYTMVSGNKYHQNCFVCFTCSGSLEKGYIEKEGNPYCGKCGSQPQQTRSFSTTPKIGGAPRPNGLTGRK
ncbi:hypothetical protein DICPUDRAFT_33256 [Dictyostelium purpureum]|uniref:LIM zinc-binding domain-containing protein n=1 Tax=Dictyostelium purpureum TaxID=5786 RepID=F0ZKI1_DICPU|nr:uncharacterized protein DICPUDRAFT_33256 [Dictyostelium purpureum]EGC35546.1 hypothetical protein DICPUDRAFT_33256 [Dictyostelium purpureum]|eukprot:XP_003287917.1 hypothetical protein DICPUDRAFT_33256 [Dictyostelium purpureum]